MVDEGVRLVLVADGEVPARVPRARPHQRQHLGPAGVEILLLGDHLRAQREAADDRPLRHRLGREAALAEDGRRPDLGADERAAGARADRRGALLCDRHSCLFRQLTSVFISSPSSTVANDPAGSVNATVMYPPCSSTPAASCTSFGWTLTGRRAPLTFRLPVRRKSSGVRPSAAKTACSVSSGAPSGSVMR